jgi:UPF0755 protein
VKRLLVVLLLLALAAAAALAGAYVWAERQLAALHAFGPAGGEREFEVAAGETSRAVLERLEQDGLIRSALVARVFLSRVMGDPPLQAGLYRFASPVSTFTILRMLREGEVATFPVTIVEGSTYFETAATLAAAGFGARAELLAEFERPQRIADRDPAAQNLEGYLFPDTYRFPRGVSAGRLADALVGNFRARFDGEVAPLVAGQGARPLRELVILASLVEKEARLPEERPLVAAVYANRLARGIGLFADPTIIYGLKLEGRWDGDIRRRDLEADSPWNTYRVGGLPPGPICSPGVASLAAAARPADAPYLYFVSKNDGSHVFSETLAEHRRAVERWQVRYWRDRRAGR